MRGVVDCRGIAISVEGSWELLMGEVRLEVVSLGICFLVFGMKRIFLTVAGVDSGVA